LHSASRQQDANFIWLVASHMQIEYFVCMVASRMQFKSRWLPTELNLHPDGGQLNEICIWLAANRMQITQLAHC
jgi:hypothetical protein